MRRRFCSILFIFVACFIFMASVNSFAEESAKKKLNTADSSMYDQETTRQLMMQDKEALDKISDGPIRKLGRGLSNVFLGVVEIPLKIYKTNMEEGGIAACSYGVLNGLFYFITREVTGVIEILTFPIPLPGAAEGPFATGWGYGPLMQPEWILTFETDPYNTVYPNFPVH